MTDIEHQIIHQLILDRWNPHRISKKIADHFGLSINKVRHIRRKPAFQAEYAKQLEIYQGSFEDVRLADRKERVRALSGLFEKIPDCRIALNEFSITDCELVPLSADCITTCLEKIPKLFK